MNTKLFTAILLVVSGIVLLNSRAFCTISAATLKNRPSTESTNAGTAKGGLSLSGSVSKEVDDDLTTGATPFSEFTKANCKPENQCRWTVQPWPFKSDLVMNLETGTIQGTPQHPWSVLVHVTATRHIDKGKWWKVARRWKVVKSDLSIEITPAQAPAIMSAFLPTKPVGQSVSEYLRAEGGTPSYQWNVIPDPNNPQLALPPGLTMDSNGQITGVPTTPGTYAFQVQVIDHESKSSSSSPYHEVTMTIDPAPDCNNPKYSGNTYFNGFFPLTRSRNTNPSGNAEHGSATDYDVQCFWGSSGLLTPLTQIHYLYGFGGGANTISADMISVQMPAPVGVQVSLGSSVTAGGSSTTTTQALQSVEAGGNFYIHAQYPIYVTKNNHATFLLNADPKVGFSFNGFAGQTTLSQGTEQYISAPIEAYGEYEGLGNAGGAYVDAHVGFESVPGAFATTAGLNHHNFVLKQVTFGFNFAGLMRIGAQRYWGPSGAFNASGVDGFNKWHLVLQLAPKGN